MRRGLPALALALAGAAPQPLKLPATWVHGAPGEPVLEVHEAAPGTWILRQSKRANFEAPFLYLLAGSQRALLLDTGAEPAEGTSLPLRQSVDTLLEKWARARGIEKLGLVVAHTHGHRDHVFGDAQFRDRPETVVVGTKSDEVAAFFKLDRWPEGTAELDLGGRVLTVLPLPGHEPAHLAVYDPANGIVLSGDTLYPGLLTIRDWPAFRASVARLQEFVKSHPVTSLLGAHIEMTRTPRAMYPLETPFQPQEHALALAPAHLAELDRACRDLGDARYVDVHDDFILWRVLPRSTDRPSTHGMLMVGEEAVYLSHLPMFHAPHDYQLIFEAGLPEEARASYAADRRSSREPVYTLVPTDRWALTDKVTPGATFLADVYRGHFERGGTPILKGITVTVKGVVHFRRLEPGLGASPSAWLAFGRGGERFLAHALAGPPDMDQVVEVTGSPAEGTALELPVGARLRDGQRIGGVRVRRVLYTEYDDLAK